MTKDRVYEINRKERTLNTKQRDAAEAKRRRQETKKKLEHLEQLEAAAEIFKRYKT